MRTATIKAFPAAVSATTNGAAIPSEQMFYVAAQAVVTGSPVGVLKLQASIDIVNQTVGGQAPTNWFDIPSATVSTSAAGTVGIPKTDLCYPWIRPVFTLTSGTGSVVVTLQVMGQ